jgi:hypothetical protein
VRRDWELSSAFLSKNARTAALNSGGFSTIRKAPVAELIFSWQAVRLPYN